MLTLAIPSGRRRADSAALGLLVVVAVAGLVVGRPATAAELPIAVAPGPVTTDEDLAVQITLSGTDDDGDELTYSITTVPAHGTVLPLDPGQCTPVPPDPCDVTVTYTPSGDFNGSDSFAFTVADGVDGTSSPATVDLTIDPINDPPLAADDNATGPEDESIDVFVLENDSDVDGDLLSITDATDGVHGTTAIVGAGNNIRVQYTPDENFNGLDQLTYMVDDGNGGSATGTVSITVDPVNDDPVADNESVTGTEDVPRSINVLIGDADVDGDTLTIVGATDGAHGTAAIIASGTRVRYTPAADFNGPDTFTYTVDDGHGGQDTATVTITLTAVNDAPTVEIPFEPVVDEDAGPQSFGGFLDGVEGPANEVSTQNVDFAIDDVTATSLFSVQPAVNPNGTLTFTPAANANGVSTVTVHSFDTGGTANGGVDVSPQQSFTITITPANDAPTAADDGVPTPIAVAQTAGPTPLTVLANDTALPDTGETLSIVAVTQGANGSVAITGSGTGLGYDPTGSFTGADTFTYTISDGALEATATVHINVAPDITPPVTSIRVVGTAGANSSSVRVTVRWSAFELQSGVARYQLQQRTDDGAWTTITLSPVNATRIERVLAGGHDYAFRIRAFDGIGNQGAYATSRTLRL